MAFNGQTQGYEESQTVKNDLNSGQPIFYTDRTINYNLLNNSTMCQLNVLNT